MKILINRAKAAGAFLKRKNCTFISTRSSVFPIVSFKIPANQIERKRKRRK